MRGASILLALVLAGSTPAPLERARDHSGLPVIGPAPNFVLRAQDGTSVALDQLRGKVVAITFIFTSCSATCPVLTAKMAAVQDRLAGDFGSKIVFLSITVDPEHDKPEVLQRYSQAFGANPAGWKFLTGAPGTIRTVERLSGVFASSLSDGDLDHTNLTSIVDTQGMLRVQYLGVRFDPDEFRKDLESLVESS